MWVLCETMSVFFRSVEVSYTGDVISAFQQFDDIEFDSFGEAVSVKSIVDMG